MNKCSTIITIVATIMLLIGIVINNQRVTQQAEEHTVVQEKNTQEGCALDEVVARSGECVYAVDSTVTKIVSSYVEITDCTGNVWLVDSDEQARILTEKQKVYTVFSDRGTHDNRQDDEVLCILARQHKHAHRETHNSDVHTQHIIHTQHYYTIAAIVVLYSVGSLLLSLTIDTDSNSNGNNAQKKNIIFVHYYYCYFCQLMLYYNQKERKRGNKV